MARSRTRIVILAACLIATTAMAAEWQRETVDAGDAVGLYPAIAVDPSGGVYISYYDAGPGDLKVATKTTGAWRIQAVDTDGNVGTHTSITVDGWPAPHVVYRDETNDYVKYAWFDTTSWHTDVFDDGGGNGFYTAIAINVDTDALFIEYRNTFTQVLHVVLCEEDCVFEIPDEGQAVDWGASMARGVGDVLNVTYQDAESASLWHAQRDGSGWTTENVDPAVDTGRINSVAVDSQGRPHVGYYAFADGDVRYAVKSDGAWTTETVDGADWVGFRTSIAVDPSDRPHLVYFDLTDQTIEHAVKDGGAWTIDTVGENADEYCAVAAGADGSLHVAYHDTASGLAYAYLAPVADDDDDTGDDDTADDDAGDDTAGDDSADDTGDDDSGGHAHGGCGR